MACLILFNAACRSKEPSPISEGKQKLPEKFLLILGVAQDAGFPQIGCTRECCAAYWEGRETKKDVTCMALVDQTTNQYWLFEATPDITHQLHVLQAYIPWEPDFTPDGIFITHAHIGHYTGLMQLGREAMGADHIPVWVMPRMDSFLRFNGPWSQLITLGNIELKALNADSTVAVNNSFKVTPIIVPHRDEFSETVGFLIQSNHKKILFIPDIDKWDKWDRDIVAEIGKVDIALLDGTFYSNGELSNRDMSEVPHPFVEESLQKFSSLPASERAKIIFIHFNHTNPLLKRESKEKSNLVSAGFAVASEEMVIGL